MISNTTTITVGHSQGLSPNTLRTVGKPADSTAGLDAGRGCGGEYCCCGCCCCMIWAWRAAARLSVPGVWATARFGSVVCLRYVASVAFVVTPAEAVAPGGRVGDSVRVARCEGASRSCAALKMALAASPTPSPDDDGAA